MKTKVNQPTLLQQNEDVYLQLQNQIEFLQKQCEELKTAIIAGMKKLGIEETDRLKLVNQTRTDFNVDALRTILSAHKFNRIRMDAIDRKAYESAVKLGILDPEELSKADAVKLTAIEFLRKRI